MFLDVDSGRNFEDVSVGIVFTDRLRLLLWEYLAPDGAEKAPVGSLGTSSSRAWVLFVKRIVKLVFISWRVDGPFRGVLESADG